MSRILELFAKRPQPSEDELRRQSFFAKAPSLKGLAKAYDDALEAERDVKVSDYTEYTYIPDSLDQFKLISPVDLTPEVLRCGARHTRHIAKLFGVRYSGNYAELVKRLHAATPLAIEHIHGAFISDLMAAEYVLNEPINPTQKIKSQWIFDTKHFSPGPLFIHSVLLRDPFSAPGGDWRKTGVIDQILKDIILASPGQASHLCPPWLERQELLEQMICEGFNPPGMNDNRALAVRISTDMSLKDQLISLSKCKSEEHFEIACVKGLIKRNSIEEVVSAADTWSLKGALLSLYSRDELMPHIRNDQVAKGRMIEDDLGL